MTKINSNLKSLLRHTLHVFDYNVNCDITEHYIAEESCIFINALDIGFSIDYTYEYCFRDQLEYEHIELLTNTILNQYIPSTTMANFISLYNHFAKYCELYNIYNCESHIQSVVMFYKYENELIIRFGGYLYTSAYSIMPVMIRTSRFPSNLKHGINIYEIK